MQKCLESTLWTLIAFLWFFCTSTLAAEPFRFPVSIEPTGIDPAKISSSESNYFVFNVMRGLYRISDRGESVPELAERCSQSRSASGLKTTCIIRQDAKWSDGKAVTAHDFVFSWRRLLSPNTKGLGAELLQTIAGAALVHSGTIPAERLGIAGKTDRILEITHSEDDPEFLDKIAHPALAPIRDGFSYDRAGAQAAPVTGPYKIAEWSNAQKIKMTPNIQYDHFARPDVEVLVIDDDETALNLYRAGTLSLLRRLPGHYLKAWKASKELHFFPIARFDSIGFGPVLSGQGWARELRRTLAQALDYRQLQRLLEARGQPGCPGIDPRHFKKIPCHSFQPVNAKANFEKLRADPAASETLKRLTLAFSKLGGDDVQKGMEWVQAQWKQNLELTITLRGVEQGVYLQELKSDPPPIFRKGVGLDRDSCLASAEIFLERDPENYIRLKSDDYRKRVARLRAAQTSSERREACTAAVRYLVDEALIIPLGQIHFAVLAKPNFGGWTISPLNQLDLRRLKFSSR